jgi:hypothetical protein
MPSDTSVQSIELMNRLHELDTALASCQRQAIAVEELRKVWELHCDGLDQVGGSNGVWVEELLRKVAVRHGIFGLVNLGPRPAPIGSSDGP